MTRAFTIILFATYNESDDLERVQGLFRNVNADADILFLATIRSMARDKLWNNSVPTTPERTRFTGPIFSALNAQTWIASRPRPAISVRTRQRPWHSPGRIW